MERVLLVTDNEKGRARLQAILQDMGYTDVTVCADPPAAKAAIKSTDFSLIVVNAPLKDGGEEAFGRYVIRQTYASVILLTREASAAALGAALEPLGAIVLGKPLQIPLFRRLLLLAEANRHRLLGLRIENAQLQHRLDELRLVDRAKCVLIQYLGIGEPQAHRYIEKQAMDRRVPRTEIAREILKTYEL